MQRTLIFPFLSLLFYSGQAQDTIRVMTYNILNYSESHYPNRYNDLREIIAYTDPDAVICQEVQTSVGANLLLNNAFNPGGGSTWTRATFIDGPDSDNTLFYKPSKVKFKSQNQISTDGPRYITRYRLYTLTGPTDTAWINLFSLHLKASSGFSDANMRLEECKDLCTWMSNLNSNENIIVGGDFNFYNQSTEPGFTWLTSTNCSHKLYDPINTIGNWHNSSLYTNVHTQSTRTALEPDGGPNGGLDDRFDFLLVNDRIVNGLSKVRYVPGSYTTVGQDGLHFNLAVNAPPTNAAVPALIANSLYNMSDHLPVYLDLAIGNEVGYSEYSTNLPGTNVKWIYSENSTTADFLLNTTNAQELTVRIYDLTGKEIQSRTIMAPLGQFTLSMDMSPSAKGQYLLKLETNEGWTGCKFIRY